MLKNPKNMKFQRATLKKIQQDRWQVMSLFALPTNPTQTFTFRGEWAYFFQFKLRQLKGARLGWFWLLCHLILFWRKIISCILKCWLFLIHRWTHFSFTSTNHAGSSQRDQQNWAVVEFKEGGFGKRFWDFWQSRRGKLHVSGTFRAAWPCERS